MPSAFGVFHTSRHVARWVEATALLVVPSVIASAASDCGVESTEPVPRNHEQQVIHAVVPVHSNLLAFAADVDFVVIARPCRYDTFHYDIWEPAHA